MGRGIGGPQNQEGGHHMEWMQLWQCPSTPQILSRPPGSHLEPSFLYSRDRYKTGKRVLRFWGLYSQTPRRFWGGGATPWHAGTPEAPSAAAASASSLSARLAEGGRGSGGHKPGRGLGKQVGLTGPQSGEGSGETWELRGDPPKIANSKKNQSCQNLGLWLPVECQTPPPN